MNVLEGIIGNFIMNDLIIKTLYALANGKPPHLGCGLCLFDSGRIDQQIISDAEKSVTSKIKKFSKPKSSVANVSLC